MSEALFPESGADFTAGHTSGNEGMQQGEPAGAEAQSQAGGSAGGALPLSDATLRQLECICERLGASRERSPQMARQLVKRAGQLARERDWSEAQALEHLLDLLLKASAGGDAPQPYQ